MTHIIGISGKKMSGKDTLANGLMNILKDHGTVKKFSFADGLKDILVDILGLRPEQVRGTDEDKNTSTKYIWENFPEFIRWDNGGRKFVNSLGEMLSWEIPKNKDNAYDIERIYWDLKKDINPFYKPCNLKSGQMTARELMQVMGTDICRRMFSQYIWVESIFRIIKKENVDFAFISDLRFPSEFESLHNNSGFVIRLHRNVGKIDQHPSEIALDNWDWDGYERVLQVPSLYGIDEARNLALEWLIKDMGIIKDAK